MIRITDINEFEPVFQLAEQLPESEKALFRALTGAEFQAQDFMVALAEMVGDSPHQFTYFVGEMPIAAGGFLPQRPGVYRTWFIAPDLTWHTYGRELTDVIATQVQKFLDDKLAHRIETVTLAGRPEVQAWYERIGLTFESTLRGYGANGEDAVMHVAVRKAEMH